MKFSIIFFVALCIAFVVCQTRPKLPESFFSLGQIEISENGTKSSGSGMWAIDQVRGRGLIHYDFGREDIVIWHVLRYDLRHLYIINPGPNNCTVIEVQPPMPTAWQWLNDATYNGTVHFRGRSANLWTAFDEGRTKLLAVDSLDVNRPYYYEEVTSTRHTTIYTDSFDTGRVDQRWFDVPNECGTPSPVLFNKKSEEKKYKFNNDSALVGLLPITVCDNTIKCAKEICGTCHCPYVYGDEDFCCTTHRGGFDCSGMVQYSYVHCGKWNGMPRTTFEMYADLKTGCGACKPDATKDCIVGDLFFYYPTSTGPDHVVMYIGDGKVAECPHTGLDCHIITPYMVEYVGCRRLCE